jgi:ABC-type multidrug transport system ATPase subunit
VIGKLEMRQVAKSYGRKRVFDAFDGTFEPGKLTALVGPNGAGKTTLMRIAAGLQTADAGEIVRPAPAAYFGGFDTIPVAGSVRTLRVSLGVSAGDDRRSLSGLSRGELQLVGLEIVLDLAPAILLLDEPWTALEPHVRRELTQRLSGLASQGRIVVCSSHDLDEVLRAADDVVFLNDGKGVWMRAHERVDQAALMAMFEKTRETRLRKVQ